MKHFVVTMRMASLLGMPQRDSDMAVTMRMGQADLLHIIVNMLVRIGFQVRSCNYEGGSRKSYGRSKCQNPNKLFHDIRPPVRPS